MAVVVLTHQKMPSHTLLLQEKLRNTQAPERRIRVRPYLKKMPQTVFKTRCING